MTDTSDMLARLDTLLGVLDSLAEVVLHRRDIIDDTLRTKYKGKPLPEPNDESFEAELIRFGSNVGQLVMLKKVSEILLANVERIKHQGHDDAGNPTEDDNDALQPKH